MDEFEIVAETALTVVELFGRLHPLAVHMPIAATIFLLMHETAAYFNVKGFRETAPFYVLTSVLSYLPAVATGWIRSRDFQSDTLIRIMEHRNLMLGALVLLTFAAGWRLSTRRLNWVYLVVLFISLVVMSMSADIGGKLVYGEDYFGGE